MSGKDDFWTAEPMRALGAVGLYRAAAAAERSAAEQLETHYSWAVMHLQCMDFEERYLRLKTIGVNVGIMMAADRGDRAAMSLVVEAAYSDCLSEAA